MARITIPSRLQAAPEMAGFLDSFAPRLAAGLELRLFGEEGSRGGASSGLLEALRGMRESVLEAGRELWRRDEEVLAQERAAGVVRRRRDRAAEQLRKSLVRDRKLIEVAYGTRGVEVYLGLRETTSEDPVVLLRQGRRAQALLTAAELPAPRLGLVDLDSAEFVKQLARQGDALESALSAAVYARAQEQAAVLARKQAVRAFDALYRPAYRWIASLCELAGLAEHMALIPVAGKGFARPRSAVVAGSNVSLPAPPSRIPVASSPFPLSFPAP